MVLGHLNQNCYRLRYHHSQLYNLLDVSIRFEANSTGVHIPADVGVTGFEIGVVGFSRSSIFLADGVLALLLVPLLGDGGGTSFFT